MRPILLIQADRVDACQPLRDRLVAEFGLVAEEIKISTGKLNELKGINNISEPVCGVRFIITVEKLRDALVSNGFTPPEAETLIMPTVQPLMPLGDQPKTVMLPPESLDGTVFRAQSAVLAGKVKMDEPKGERALPFHHAQGQGF